MNAGSGAGGTDDGGAPGSIGGIGPPRRSPRVRVAVGAIVVLALVGVGAAVVGSLVTPGGATSIVGGPDSDSAGGEGSESVVREGDAALDPVDAPSSAAVVVHVLGAVRRPGVVEVRAGDRVLDAIAAAGGTTDEAELAGVNLARVLADGEQLYVPRVGEVPPSAIGGAGGAGGGAAESGLVNINTADASALDTLAGVGPALASRIIAWRDANGPFRSVDELLAVSGIGEKTLAGFRDQVTV